MANIRYIIKDPSFKYFIIGLGLFVLITGGGIMAVKKLVSDKNSQKEELAVVEDQKKSDNVVVIDDIKPSQSNDQTIDSSNGSVDTKKTTSGTTSTVAVPNELSRTGSNGLAMTLGLAVLTYVVTLALQKH